MELKRLFRRETVGPGGEIETLEALVAESGATLYRSAGQEMTRTRSGMRRDGMTERNHMFGPSPPANPSAAERGPETRLTPLYIDYSHSRLRIPFLLFPTLIIYHGQRKGTL